MSKTKKLLIALMLLIVVLLLPNMVNAAVEYTRNFPSNDGTIELNLTGLELSDSKQYEFSLVSKGGTPETDSWNLITNYTTTTAKLVLSSGTSNIINVLKVANDGQIFIREKDNTEGYVVDRLNVDLTLPYLQSLVYTKNNNGYYDIYGNELYGSIGNHYQYTGSDHTYVQWQKVENTELITKFLEIKNNSGSLTGLESYLPTCPTMNWTADRAPKYSEKNDGLYLLWVKRTGDNCKEVYSCIIHDGLPNATAVEEYLGTGEPSTPVNSISLPSTKTIELGKTLTLTPGFNPTTATNKIVTWESSDETVATVDNAGKITPKKVGSTIIKVTSQDGNKTATCTVTVTANTTNEEQKKYISFPIIIYFGTTTIDLKSGVYDGDYTMYYQFVEVTNENEETKYDDTKWIEMKDRKPEKPSVEFTGTKKFALWIKLVMEDKTVYESQIYEFNGSTTVSTVNEKKTFNNHSYQIIDKLMSWQEAKEYCESLGGHLVTITSAEEQAFITSLVKEQGFTTNRFWMGATDKDKEGTWKWITGEKYNYTNWGNGQPNDRESGGQDFGVFVGINSSKHSEYAGKWDDINEDSEEDIYFICEWGDIEKEATTNQQTTTKDTTTATSNFPNTGKVLLFWIIGIVAVSGIVAHVRYKKLYM